MTDKNLWEHQKRAIEFARDKDEIGLFYDVGTGKTRTALEIMLAKYKVEGRPLRTLVVAPIIVLENWRREIQGFTDIEASQVQILIGSGAKRIKVFREAAFKNEKPLNKIFILNYESLLMDALMMYIASWRPELLIADEIHKAKSIKAKRTKALIRLADNSKYRIGLTGTPVLNSPMDLFSQFRILDKGETFGQNFFGFRHTYFHDKNAGMPSFKHFPNWQIKPGALDLMNQKVMKKAVHVKKQDCLDLPPLVKKTIYVELAKDQKKSYEELKADFITYISDKACVAQLAITKALRLQQIISGFIPLEEDSLHVFQQNPKLEALKELVQEISLHHKLIIWAVFKLDKELITAMLGSLKINYVTVTGDDSYDDKISSIDRFNHSSDCPVLVGHPGAAGVGVNLTAADVAIFYSRNFSLEHEEQAIARCYRAGSERHEKITRIDIVAKNTIDELILQALENKQKIGLEILKDIGDKL